MSCYGEIEVSVLEEAIPRPTLKAEERSEGVKGGMLGETQRTAGFSAGGTGLAE